MTAEPPGVGIVVWRRGAEGLEWLVLHRAHWYPDFAGDWAWGPPGGARDHDETSVEAAQRELFEEVGLELDCVPTGCGTDLAIVFHAEASPDAEVALSPEHDAFEWLPLDEARRRCLPAFVGEQFACVAALVEEEHS